MYEIYEAAFSGVNVVYTTLLLLAMLYWLIVILGVLDFGSLDLDIDVDAGGFDADADFDADLGGDGTAGGFSWLAFFNFGEVPLMFYVSIMFLIMWVVSIQTNHMIDEYGPQWMNDYQDWIGAALIIPNVVFALFMTKFLLIPIKRVRRREPQHTNLVGKVGIVSTQEVNEEFGRCELPEHEDSLILNIRTREGEVLKKGDPVVILEQVGEDPGDYFVVTKKVYDK